MELNNGLLNGEDLECDFVSNAVLHVSTGTVWNNEISEGHIWTLSGDVERIFLDMNPHSSLRDKVQFSGTGFLAYNHQYRNAYHILIEWASALFAFCELGLATRNCSVFLPASHQSNQYLSALISFLGISNNVVWLKDSDQEIYVEIEQLIIPKSIFSDGFDYKYKKFVEWYFSSFVSWLLRFEKRIERPRQIYVSRSDSNFRRIQNECDLENLVQARGFEVVCLSKMSLLEIVKAFTSAEVIVGPHGAGLSNLVFRRNRRQILELMPATYVNPCFRVISEGHNEPHDFLMMQELVSDANHRNRVFKADLSLLREAIEAM